MCARDSKQHLAAAWSGRKLDLWALPFARVLYMDLDEMILPTSPFNPLLDKLPSDLWSNAEAYLVQLEENGTLFA